MGNNKRVRFSREVVVVGCAEDALLASSSSVPPPASSLEEESTRRWWSSFEMKQVRQVAKLVSRDTRQKSWMTSSFERAYHQSKRFAKSHQDEPTLQIMIQSIKPDQDLIDWCRYGHSKRGLEQWSSEQHRTARNVSAINARYRVILIQKQCDADLIQQISERASRTSRIFARLVGQADAEAIMVSSS